MSISSSGSKSQQPPFWNDSPVAKMVRSHLTSLACYVLPRQLPVVYHEKYNVRFFGIEKLHPFDACKYEKIMKILIHSQLFSKDDVVSPLPVTDKQLLDVHTPEYIDDVKTSRAKLAEITELPVLKTIPNAILQRCLATPFRYQCGGTIMAALLALERGWAINMGGGMHHAYYENGMGWCAFDDLMLAIRECRRVSQKLVKNVLVIDLDVHQANGFERDKLYLNDQHLYILDMYNPDIFPGDGLAKEAINLKVEVPSHTSDEVYLGLLTEALQRAAAEFEPQLIVYNAGTDILAGDPLGLLDVSAAGVRERDHMVWQFAADLGVPICMCLSGGYAKDTAELIASSISCLFESFELYKPDSKLHKMRGLNGICTTAELSRRYPKESQHLERAGTGDSLRSNSSNLHTAESTKSLSGGERMIIDQESIKHSALHVLEGVEQLRESIRNLENASSLLL